MLVTAKTHQVRLFPTALQMRLQEVMTVPYPLSSRAVMACFLLSVLPSEHIKGKASVLFGDLIICSENELTFLVSMDGCWHQFSTNRNPQFGAQ